MTPDIVSVRLSKKTGTTKYPARMSAKFLPDRRQRGRWVWQARLWHIPTNVMMSANKL
jgi:hypothetical protein